MAKSEVSAVDLVSQQELCGLLARLNQRLDTHVRRVGEQLSITSSQVVALREMSEPMKLTELATRMACETSNAGYVVDRMAEQDLVTRTPHPSDRRAKILTLTKAGERCRANVLAALQQNSPTATLSASEAQQLRELLARAVD